jgi:GNAT superfamily N-acetyltransferase
LEISIQVVTAERWPDAVIAFGSRGQSPDSCWCQRYIAPSELSNREALQQEVRSSTVPPGLLAYVDGVPAGWTRTMPRDTLPGVATNRALQRILGDGSGVWWATCFAIRAEYRGSGVGTALLAGAVDHARRQGALALEGHPVDVSRLRAGKASGSALFTGTLRMFERLGFREIGRTYPSRPVMHLDLDPSAAP